MCQVTLPRAGNYGRKPRGAGGGWGGGLEDTVVVLQLCSLIFDWLFVFWSVCVCVGGGGGT